MPQYVQFWIVLITVPNLIVIALMVLVFALLVLLPIPRHIDSPSASMETEMDRRETHP